jgi:hypothetical protein
MRFGLDRDIPNAQLWQSVKITSLRKYGDIWCGAMELRIIYVMSGEVLRFHLMNQPSAATQVLRAPLSACESGDEQLLYTVVELSGAVRCARPPGRR